MGDILCRNVLYGKIYMFSGQCDTTTDHNSLASGTRKLFMWVSLM